MLSYVIGGAAASMAVSTQSRVMKTCCAYPNELPNRPVAFPFTFVAVRACCDLCFVNFNFVTVRACCRLFLLCCCGTVCGCGCSRLFQFVFITMRVCFGSFPQDVGGRSNAAMSRLGPAQAVRISRLDPRKQHDLARLALAVYFRCVCCGRLCFVRTWRAFEVVCRI